MEEQLLKDALLARLAPVPRLTWLECSAPNSMLHRGAIAFPLMVGSDEREPSRPLRLIELLASVSLATDLGTGQPPGHALRTSAIAIGIADAIGCSPEEIRTVQQFALLRFLGCTADAAETAASVGGDDIAYNAAMAQFLMGTARRDAGPALRSVAPGQPRMRRLRLVARTLADPKGVERSLTTHCEVAVMLARRIDLEPSVVDALAHAYERWDGKGFPDRLRGDACHSPCASSCGEGRRPRRWPSAPTRGWPN